MADFDAIVIGSGMSGGWAAKELTEKGLKTLVIERGRHIEPGKDYTDFKDPWETPLLNELPEDDVVHYGGRWSQLTKHFAVRRDEHPYSTPPDKPFKWTRGYHLGGRSLMWARQSYRLSDIDFEANKNDGHGVDWPIRYTDLAPWYDHVETFAGVSGSAESLPQLPDGNFQPPMELNCVELELQKNLHAAFPSRRLTIGRCAHLTAPTEEQIALGRAPCQFRDHCSRGCSFGAYFSSISATLPAAHRTGNLTVVTDAICDSVVYDAETERASGVRVVDRLTKERREFSGRMIFLCASALGTTQIMLNSVSTRFPRGIANDSDMLGRNLMDHISGMGAVGKFPGHQDIYYSGRRPNGFYIPRFRNVTEPASDFVRGYGFQGGASRGGWRRPWEKGVGAEYKKSLTQPGDWHVWLAGFGEMLPNPENRVTLKRNETDQWGIPILHIDCAFGENDLALARQANADAIEILEASGFVDVEQRTANFRTPGDAVHEMGTARMGRDPTTSVLNGVNQAHAVANLFVTDGACMTSSACQNPSLTYMAITARAANNAASMLKEGVL